MTTILFGRQKIYLRGHRDNTKDVANDGTANHVNFLALLDFLVKTGDRVLGMHLSTAAKNALFTSWNIHNQLIHICGEQIRDIIFQKVKTNKFFSIITTEITDSACKEQLSIVLRYVDPNDDIREDLVDFLECDNEVTGRFTADKVTNSITGCGPYINNLRGQAFDGASNVAGSSKGAAAIIKETNHSAFYQHCSTHALNVAVVKSIQITSIRNMMAKEIVEASREVNCVKAGLKTSKTTWMITTLNGFVKLQRHRDNTSADGPAEYYWRTVAIPLLDHLLAEME
ncbi:52 kDa repressor of the inhibitor of the protein kinase-like, partial [Homarus americanus]|uniref:52 kDa repressor of the inhibitor of the protein kinase-like n=1 Tax=Homarus americanus TaxID=6706 RepID=UPI001C47ED1B